MEPPSALAPSVVAGSVARGRGTNPPGQTGRAFPSVAPAPGDPSGAVHATPCAGPTVSAVVVLCWGGTK